MPSRVAPRSQDDRDGRLLGPPDLPVGEASGRAGEQDLRQIGSKTGTGGSAGAPYLRTTLSKRFYPDLWDLRSHL